MGLKTRQRVVTHNREVIDRYEVSGARSSKHKQATNSWESVNWEAKQLQSEQEKHEAVKEQSLVERGIPFRGEWDA